MINIYIGENGQGKTLLLEDYIDNIDNKESIVTNFVDILGLDIRKLSKERLSIVLDEYNSGKLFDGYDVAVKNGKIIPDVDTKEYSDEYIDIITLLCKDGDILVLDEPDMGLDLQETSKLQLALIMLIPTYKNVRIAFHSQSLLGMEDFIDINYYWVQNYKAISITEEQVYEAIGTI